jgi:D-alanyl-D-alanine carboxypeptidase
VSRPNYELRRLVALTALVVLGYSVFRIGGAVGSALRSTPGRTALTSPSATVTNSPSSPGTPIVPVAVPPPCAKGNDPAADARSVDWARTLLDPQYRLPASYVPPKLVSVADAGFNKVGALVIRSIVIQDLTALRQAAAGAGNPIDIVAAYRSYNEQASLFSRRKLQLGLAEAERKTARAGHSEHQLGTALDFKTLGEVDVTAGWDSAPAGLWMLENAWTFGFIQSYPKGKSKVACYGYEPWHYRYFGRDRAAAIHQSALTVREYLWNEALRVP